MRHSKICDDISVGVTPIPEQNDESGANGRLSHVLALIDKAAAWGCLVAIGRAYIEGVAAYGASIHGPMPLVEDNEAVVWAEEIVPPKRYPAIDEMIERIEAQHKT